MIIFHFICLITSGPPDCPNKNISPCECFGTYGTIRCHVENDTLKNLNAARLREIGDALTGLWHVLEINNTSIDEITKESFKNVRFEKIFIVNNQNLSGIANDSFKDDSSTTDVVVRKNKILSNIDFVKIFKNVRNFELDENSITNIETKTFNNLTNLEIIHLEKQQPNNMTIDGLAFKTLRNLKLLNLDGNKIENIAENAIDLSETIIPQNDNLTIHLNSSNYIISNIQIINPPINQRGNFYVNLKGNHLEKLEDGFIDKIEKSGTIFLDTTNATKCLCTEVPKIVAALKLERVQGIYHFLQCNETKGPTSKKVPLIDCNSAPTAPPSTGSTPGSTKPSTAAPTTTQHLLKL